MAYFTKRQIEQYAGEVLEASEFTRKEIGVTYFPDAPEDKQKKLIDSFIRRVRKHLILNYDEWFYYDRIAEKYIILHEPEEKRRANQAMVKQVVTRGKRAMQLSDNMYHNHPEIRKEIGETRARLQVINQVLIAEEMYLRQLEAKNESPTDSD